jgi:histidyl-tRNA synthetase
VEVKAKDIEFGSIGGGGRYDDLTGVFGLKDVSGVGISFGADRIYDCLEQLNLFPENTTQSLKVLFTAFDDAAHHHAFKVLTQARAAGINADIYPEPSKIKKQLDYADKRQVPYVVIIGSEEMETGNLTLKNMVTGEQEKLTIEAIIEKLV